MTTITAPRRSRPAGDVDPFSAEVLEDPLPFHTALREPGRWST